ncbi:hypothetical protein [Paenibacillus polymyxa]|nr:hypothetical protein [Paenibacillus polymyxa]
MNGSNFDSLVLHNNAAGLIRSAALLIMNWTSQPNVAACLYHPVYFKK